MRSIWRMRLALGTILAFWGMAGNGLACSVGADPGVTLEPTGAITSWNRVSLGAAGCNLGLVQIDIDEGAGPIGFKAMPVDPSDATGCTATNNWATLITMNGDGGDLNLFNIFGDADTFLSFVSSGESGSTFSFNLSPNPAGVTPANGGQTEFALLKANLALMGDPDAPIPAVTGTWKVVGTAGSPTGMVSIDPTQVQVKWFGRPLKGDMPEAYKPYVPTSSLGYNPGAPKGPLPTTTGNLGGPQIFMTYTTPSFSGPGVPPITDGRYGVFAEVVLPWNFSGVSIPLWVSEEKTPCVVDSSITPAPSPLPTCGGFTPPACAAGCTGGTPSYGPNQLLTINFSGTIMKSAKPGAGEGHPSLALVSVRDITEPLVAVADPRYDLPGGPFPAGRPIPSGSGDVSVTLWDNNPYTLPSEYEAEAWYLVERSDWEGGYGGLGGALMGQNAGKADPDAMHVLEADDTWAASPEHKFRWAYAGLVQGSSAAPLSSGGDPLGQVITFPPFPDVAEPLGVHFATSATSGGEGTHMNYTPDGLKLVYKIRQTGVGGDRPNATPEAIPDMTIAQDWGDVMKDDFKTTGSDVADPAHDGDADPLIRAASGMPGFKLYGVPTWDVSDDIPPSLVITAFDRKYERYYYFGDAFQAGAACTGGTGCAGGANSYYVNAAFHGASGFNPDSMINLTIAPPGAPAVFAGNDVTDGYANMIAGYLDADSSGSYVGPTDRRDSGPSNALWIDEDTRVEFFLTAWDNVNGWDVTGPSGGVKTAGINSWTFDIVDAPSNAGSTASVMGAPGIYLFRNPNRPTDLGEASVTATATDMNSNTTTVKFNIYIADNSLRIYSLEESRRRLTN